MQNSNSGDLEANKNNPNDKIKKDEKASIQAETLKQSNSNFNNEETNVENLLKLIKDQTNELKKNKKRLEKLEEAFKKTSADLKLATSDKTNLESFMKVIFPKEMHEKVLRGESGYYNSSELSKFWLVCESKNQNEFQKILNQLKNENTDFSEKNKNLLSELDSKVKELKKMKSDFAVVSKEYADNKEKFQDTFAKYNVMESEKNYLMNLVDEKNCEIQSLRALEIENAELKAKSLLENINSSLGNSSGKNNGSLFINKDRLNSSNSAVSDKNGGNVINNNEGGNENGSFSESANRKTFGSKGVSGFANSRSVNMLKILTLNTGTQTAEEVFSVEFVRNLENQLKETKEKFDKLRKEFSDHKERSHKILMGNEENSNKIAKENEELKQKLLLLNQEINKTSLINTTQKTITNTNKNGLSTSKISESNLNNDNKNKNNNNYKKINDHYDDLNPDFKISEINSHRVSVEYLKNVLLKYLEAIAIGNEFQIKILENVIFSILKIPNSERLLLEDKRNRSSFYLNLWYNAKAYLAAKIYGNPNDAEGLENQSNLESLNFEMNKDFANLIQGSKIELNNNINNIDNNKDNNNFLLEQTASKFSNVNKAGNTSNLNNDKIDVICGNKNLLNGEDLDLDVNL